MDNGVLLNVFSHTLELTSGLDRHTTLTQFVNSARELTGAQYAAMAILDSHGETMEFIQSGVSEETATLLGHPPRGRGIFSEIPVDDYLIINDLANHPRAYGFPPGHPIMSNFLGVAVKLREQVWGRLYITNKPGGFTDADGQHMQILAQAASVAAHNAEVYEESQNRARWLAASQNIISSLLEGSEEEEALQVIAHELRVAARADISLIILPSIQDRWMSEIVDGEGSEKLLGLTFPPAGRAVTVIREQTGVVIDSLQRLRKIRVKELRGYGPALYAPLVSKGQGRGVIMLIRHIGAVEFTLHDLAMAENAAQQAVIALELAEARTNEELAAELDEKSRISRDLHDFAIQQLFASGMHVTAVKEELEGRGFGDEVSPALDQAISSIDESVRQIRQIVQSLRDDSAAAALVDRLRQETKSALQSLGFAPSLIISWQGKDAKDEAAFSLIDDAVGADISDDIVAVVREGLSNAARHAHASSVTVTLTVTTERVAIEVLDDGGGITPTLGRRSGLSNLAARARRHHGSFTITPREDGSGTRVAWEAPLA